MMRSLNYSLLVMGIIATYLTLMIKNEVNNLTYQLAQVKEIITKKESGISLLKAEVTYSSAASRLKPIAEKYLKLQPINSNQLKAETIKLNRKTKN